VSDRTYSDQELDAALASIAAPGRLRQAQDVVMRTAPSLQRLLGTALAEGGWFDLGHSQAVRQAAGGEDPAEREREVQTLVAEETRMGMLVGVAIGFELARELDKSNTSAAQTAATDQTTGADETAATDKTTTPKED
jgi:hypothetical protein